MNTYYPVWHKYRPAILKMMIDSSQEPQHYKLSDHEFRALNPKQKGGYTFTLQVTNRKATQGLKDFPVAQDLWEVLQLSPKASQLLTDSTYEFMMDKQFILHITKLTDGKTAEAV